MAEVKWIRGNKLRLSIPLQKVTVSQDGKVTEDYIVPQDAVVAVLLNGTYKKHELSAVVNDNILVVEDNGTLNAGIYAVEIIITESDGTRLRSQWPDMVHIYNDNTAVLDEFEDFPDYANGQVLEAAVFYFAKGDKGDNGLSAYEVAVRNGFEGTEEEWLESLKGNDDVYNREQSDARFVQKEAGKALSTNDYTDEDKRKVGAAITQETDPTVPSWAKSPNKPTYTAQEVGALPDDTPIPVVPTNVSAFTNDAGYLTAHQDISGKEDKVDIVAASGATLFAQVGKYYTLSNVGTLAITLPTIAAGTTHVQTVVFYISAGSTPAVTFTSTHTIIYPKDYTIEANGLYEIGAAWNGIGWVLGLLTLEIPT